MNVVCRGAAEGTLVQSAMLHLPQPVQHTKHPHLHTTHITHITRICTPHRTPTSAFDANTWMHGPDSMGSVPASGVTLSKQQLMSLQASQGTAMLDMRDVVYDDPPVKLGRGGFGEVCGCTYQTMSDCVCTWWCVYMVMGVHGGVCTWCVCMVVCVHGDGCA